MLAFEIVPESACRRGRPFCLPSVKKYARRGQKFHLIL